MRVTKSKSVLKNKQRVGISSLCQMQALLMVVLLWVMQWPYSGTVEDYALTNMSVFNPVFVLQN